VFATTIIVVVSLPIFGIAGVEGRLLTPLAFAYVVSLLASLGVAIVVTPDALFCISAGRPIDCARNDNDPHGRGVSPGIHKGSLTVQANTLPGTSLAKSDDIGRRVKPILMSQPELVATARRTGRAEQSVRWRAARLTARRQLARAKAQNVRGYSGGYLCGLSCLSQR